MARREYLVEIVRLFRQAASDLKTEELRLDVAINSARISQVEDYLRDSPSESWATLIFRSALVSVGAAFIAPLVVEFLGAGIVYALGLQAARTSRTIGFRPPGAQQQGRQRDFDLARGLVRDWSGKFPAAVTRMVSATSATALSRVLQRPRKRFAADPAFRARNIGDIGMWIWKDLGEDLFIAEETASELKNLEDPQNSEELWAAIQSGDRWLREFVSDGGYVSDPERQRLMLDDFIPEDNPGFVPPSVGTATAKLLQLTRSWLFQLFSAFSVQPESLYTELRHAYSPTRLRYYDWGEGLVFRVPGGPTAYPVRDFGWGYTVDGYPESSAYIPTSTTVDTLIGATDRAVLFAPPDYNDTFVELARRRRIIPRGAPAGLSVTSLTSRVDPIEVQRTVTARVDPRRFRAYSAMRHLAWLGRYQNERALLEMIAAMSEVRLDQAWPELAQILRRVGDSTSNSATERP